MHRGKLLQPIQLTHPKSLQTLVENRRIFSLDNCELNIFESYVETYRVPLTFGDFVITSMVRGKKVMHLPQKSEFDYLPGETVIVPAHETMVIDFPEATPESPTQCIALAVDEKYIFNTLNYLEEFYNSLPDERHSWQLRFNHIHFENDQDTTALINKLIYLCSTGTRGKNIFASLSLRELMIRLLQTQNLRQVFSESGNRTNETRMHYVIHYIHEHLTDKIKIDDLCRKAYLSRNAFFKWFREQFGITPLDYVNNERLKLAKQLLADTRYTVSEVSHVCGFSDVNYFVRLFRKSEGITPGAYKQCSAGKSVLIH